MTERKTVRRLINTMQICEKKTMQIKRRFFDFEFRDSSRYDNVIKRKGEEKLLQEAGLCREKLSSTLHSSRLHLYFLA